MKYIPFEPEQYFDEYKENIEKIRNDPNFVNIQEIIHDMIYLNKNRDKFIKYVQDNFIMGATPARLDANFPNACIFYEGYRAAWKHLLNLGLSHQMQKDAEAKNAELTK